MKSSVDISQLSTGTALCRARHALDLIAAAGLEPYEVASELQLDRASLSGVADATLPLGDFFRLRSYIAARVRDETCNMSARQLLPGSTDFVMGHLPVEGTLADVMRTVAKSYNLLHGGEYNHVEDFGGEVVFCIDDRKFPYADSVDHEQVHFVMETTLLFLHALLTIVAPPQATNGLARLAVRRLQGEENAPHLAFWSVPIRRGAYRYELAYKAAQARINVRFPPAAHLTGDAIYSQIRRLIDEGSAQGAGPGSVVQAVRDLLAQGTIEQSAVALSMGVSPATLRRYLSAEGETFRNLRREVLDAAACDLIAQGVPISTISERLGFSDVRSFNRAFRSWHGVTPKTYQVEGERAPKTTPSS